MTEPEGANNKLKGRRSMSHVRKKEAYKIFIKTTDREFHLFTFDKHEAEHWGKACLTLTDMKDAILMSTIKRNRKHNNNSVSVIAEAKPEEEQASPVKTNLPGKQEQLKIEIDENPRD